MTEKSQAPQIQPVPEQAPQTLPSQPGAGPEQPVASIRSLKELIAQVTGRGARPQPVEESAGLADVLPFPFLALVGQVEMKLALLLGLVNPGIGGVLLIGPRGTGKTTAVRSLTGLLPQVPRSLCYYGCLPEDIEAGGMDAVCPDCARKFAMGDPLAAMDDVHLVELPLNARLEDVVGGVDERAALHERMRLKRGILAQADLNLLYIDEVNLLGNDVVDAILDASAQGRFTVRRGPVSATYRSRFVLIGSMNPEEGRLRPQIMDRFGLRVMVRGPQGDEAAATRLEIYRRVQDYQAHPRLMSNRYASETEFVRLEVQTARALLPEVVLPDDVASLGLSLIGGLGIDSLRAEITLFEAARAYAAIDGRKEACAGDLRAVAPMALRMRRSKFMDEFFAHQQVEENELSDQISETLNSPDASPTPTAEEKHGP